VAKDRYIELVSSKMFIAIEGGDGTGKTTQVELLCRWLEEQGHVVTRCRDPGGTVLGESIRSILLHRDDIPMCLEAETLLYMAARAQLVRETIRPALAAGKIVVSDRYLLSNIAYQGYGGGLPVEEVRKIGLFATGGLLPDLTVVLDMPVEEALARIDRTLDRLESRGREFLERVRDGFLQEAVRAADRIAVVRADRPVEEVHAAIRRIVESMLVSRRSAT
jgi:dTMP kinase